MSECPGSPVVLQTTKKTSASPASETHALRPVTLQPSSERWARVVIAVASEPACGSVRENPPSALPAARSAPQRARSPASSHPATAAATALCIESEKASAASPRPSSSNTSMPAGNPRPLPPRSGGQKSPVRPDAATAARG